MFRGDSFGPFNADISKWDVSRVFTMRGLFEQQKDFKQDISGWDTSNVVNMYALFKDTKFNGDISKWVVLKVTQMFEMLTRNEGFAQGLWCSPSWSESPVSAASLPEGNAAFCCPTGHYLGGNGVTTFSISYLAKKTDCTKCPIGAYMDSKNIERSCSQCPTGWYQHQTGKAFCFPCIRKYRLIHLFYFN
jgi:surface protein